MIVYGRCKVRHLDLDQYCFAVKVPENNNNADLQSAFTNAQATECHT
jgi:hypothetical protein